jgi:hypothetical protein
MRLIDAVRCIGRGGYTSKVRRKTCASMVADIASAVSASDPSQDGSLTTLENVRKKYPGSKAGDAYESVWKRFFPDEHGTQR